MVNLLASIQRTENGRSAESAEEFETTSDDRSAGTDDRSNELSKNQLFEILRNSRRRAALSYLLRSRGRELSVKEVSMRVAANEYDIPPAELSPEQYKRVYTGLYQCHLEKMANLGVIDFDKDENIVRLRDVASQFAPYLDSEEGSGAERIELGIAVTVASIVTLGVTGIGPLGTVPSVLLASVTIAALLGLALFQLFELNRPQPR